MTAINELVVIEKGTALDVFRSQDAVEALINQVKDIAGDKLVEMGGVDFDVKANRDKVISLSFQVKQTKTYIESFGKDIADELKYLPKVVDASRKRIKDELDKLSTSIRQPVTEWEEQEKLRLEAIQLEKDLPRFHEEALAMNTQYDLQLAEDERKRLEREEEIRRQAIKDAETKHQIELQKAVDAEKKKAEKLAFEQSYLAEVERKKKENVEHRRTINKKL